MHRFWNRAAILVLTGCLSAGCAAPERFTDSQVAAAERRTRVSPSGTKVVFPESLLNDKSTLREILEEVDDYLAWYKIPDWTIWVLDDDKSDEGLSYHRKHLYLRRREVRPRSAADHLPHIDQHIDEAFLMELDNAFER